MSPHPAQIAAWHRTPSLTGKLWRYLIDHSDEQPDTWPASRWQAAGADPARAGDIVRELNQSDLAPIQKILDQHAIQVVTIHDPAYPSLLKEIHYPPPVLYVRGNTEALHHTALAVVGTRRPTLYGLDSAKQLVEPVARQGISIVSGLALGIDAVAHRAALSQHGPTVAVLGCGVDRVYPWQHRELADQMIAEQGAIISEFPLGAEPERHHFPQRNRIISGLSRAVLLVEAGEKSGALITAKFAVEQNREVLIVPGNITSPQSVGPLNWLKLGATAVTSAADILAVYSLSSTITPKPKNIPPLDDPIEAAIVHHLQSGPHHIDSLSETCRLDTSVISAALSLLELRGLIRHNGGMVYRLTP